MQIMINISLSKLKPILIPVTLMFEKNIHLSLSDYWNNISDKSYRLNQDMY